MAAILSVWAPVFTLRMGIPPHHLEGMTIPQMVDHMDYLEQLDKR